MQIFRTLMGYLLGTARRFWVTVSFIALIFAYFRSDLIVRALANLLGAIASAVTPFVPLAIVLFFIFLGFKIMFKGFKKRKKH